jgi:hypothetical protein
MTVTYGLRSIWMNMTSSLYVLLRIDLKYRINSPCHAIYHSANASSSFRLIARRLYSKSTSELYNKFRLRKPTLRECLAIYTEGLSNTSQYSVHTSETPSWYIYWHAIICFPHQLVTILQTRRNPCANWSSFCRRESCCDLSSTAATNVISL